jgi:hypothetical protein
MKYMLLIYDDEKIWAAMPEAERQKIFGEYMQFSKDVQESGHYKSGAPLQPTSKATSVKVRNGKRLVTDGPFAETREQLGGYYLVEAKDSGRSHRHRREGSVGKAWHDRDPARDGDPCYDINPESQVPNPKSKCHPEPVGISDLGFSILVRVKRVVPGHRDADGT